MHEVCDETFKALRAQLAHERRQAKYGYALWFIGGTLFGIFVTLWIMAL